MTTRVMPIVVILNNVSSILDYLVERTADTIGNQVERSQVIIVGNVQQTESRTVAVRPEHVAALQPWLSGQAEGAPKIVIQLTTVNEEQWLVGPKQRKQVKIAYVYSRVMATAGPDIIPIFDVQDRGLLFLQQVSPTVPYAPYIPHTTYHLASGETGVRNFLVTDYDEQGQPFTRDETARVEETIGAVQWYVALRRKKLRSFHQVLIQALDHSNPQVVRHAIRALAHQGGPNTAKLFKEKLQNASEDVRLRIMLGLWILGDQETAQIILEEFFHSYGREAWLARWDIAPSVAEEGRPVDTLYGPDPSEEKGD